MRFMSMGAVVAGIAFIVAVSVIKLSLRTPAQKIDVAKVTLTDAKNRKVQLSQFSQQGKYTIVNYWATWCGYCRKEMPLLLGAAKKNTNSKLEFVFVNSEETPKVVELYQNEIKHLGVIQHNWFDLEGIYGRAISAYGLPVTVLVDPRGEVVAKIAGQIDAPTLETLIKRTL